MCRTNTAVLALFLQALSNAKDEVINLCSFSATPETWQPLDLENDPPQLAGIQVKVQYTCMCPIMLENYLKQLINALMYMYVHIRSVLYDPFPLSLTI